MTAWYFYNVMLPYERRFNNHRPTLVDIGYSDKVADDQLDEIEIVHAVSFN